MPFRTGHEAVGRAVLYAISEGKELHELTVEQLKVFSPEIGEDVSQALSLESTLGAKNAIGGTSPSRVAEALAAARTFLDK
ncbi:MAG: hypothetical protein QM785_03975 [Pyrinomonadaceae bacterium]